MTNTQSETGTVLAMYFEGSDHAAAADDFVIQFADGGLDQHLEALFENIGRTLSLDKSTFDTDKRSITLVFE